jgi:hypothetical protein
MAPALLVNHCNVSFIRGGADISPTNYSLHKAARTASEAATCVLGGISRPPPYVLSDTQPPHYSKLVYSEYVFSSAVKKHKN